MIFLTAVITVIFIATPSFAKDVDRVVTSAPGRIEGANDIMTIGSAAAGVIKEVLVREGDRVKKDQALVRFNCAGIEAEIKRRDAEAMAFETSFKRIKAGAREEKLSIAAAEVGVSEVRADDADKALQRVRALAEEVMTKARLEETERDAKIAAAQVRIARERLRLLRQGARSEDIIEAEAKFTAALAGAEESRTRLDQCTVRAVRNGIILTTHVTPGQYIASTTPTMLLKMVDDSEYRVRAEIDERDLEKICIDQPAKVTADGHRGNI